MEVSTGAASTHEVEFLGPNHSGNCKSPSIDAIGHSGVLPDGRVNLVICGLEKPNDDNLFCESIELHRNELIYDLFKKLHTKGYHRICGFQDMINSSLMFSPIAPFDAPLSVAITTEESCYERFQGLTINQDERLIDYYGKFAQTALKADPVNPLIIIPTESGFRIEDTARRCDAEIRFKRNFRLPRDGKIYQLDKELGDFRLLPASNFDSHLPDFMAKKGGYFFSMHQTEALAIFFTGDRAILQESEGSYDYETPRRASATEPLFAVRLFVDSVNSISGRDQDYLACPQQFRFDGFSGAEGEVRQFLAPPLGLNDTNEKQFTGREVSGALRLQIAPLKNNKVDFLICEIGGTQSNNALDLLKTPNQLGLHPGRILLMKDHASVLRENGWTRAARAKRAAEYSKSHYSPRTEQCRPQLVADILQPYYNGHVQTAFRLKPAQLVTVRIEAKSSEETTQYVQTAEFSPFIPLREFLSQIFRLLEREGLGTYKSGNKGHLVIKGQRYSDISFFGSSIPFYIPIKSLELDGEIVIFEPPIGNKISNWRPRNSGSRSSNYSENFNCPVTPKRVVQYWDVGFGMGGGLIQQIHKLDPSLCEWSRSSFVDVQILNSVAFKAVTGLNPWSRLTFEQYKFESIPFYSFESEAAMGTDSIRISNTGKKQDSQEHDRFAFCPHCEVNLQDSSLMPCQHKVCSDCIRYIMTDLDEVTCILCSMTVQEVFPFSAPAEAPVPHHFAIKLIASNLEGSQSLVEATNPSLSTDFDAADAELKQFAKLIWPFMPPHQKRAVTYMIKRMSDSNFDPNGALMACGSFPEAEDLWNFVKTHKQIWCGILQLVLLIHGNESMFSASCALLRKMSGSARAGLLRIFIKYAILRISCDRLLRLLAIVSSPNEFRMADGLGYLNENQGDEYDSAIFDGPRSFGVLIQECIRTSSYDSAIALLNWAEMHSLKIEDLDIPPKELLEIGTVQHLTKALNYLTSDGRCLVKDFGLNLRNIPWRCTELAPQLAKDMVSAGADIDETGPDSSSCFSSVVCLADSKESIHLLIDLGVDLDLYNSEGNAPIHQFIEDNIESDRLKAFLEHPKTKKRIDMRNKCGLTAYHMTLNMRFSIWEEYAQILVAAGVDTTLVIPSGYYHDTLLKELNEGEYKSQKWETAVMKALGF